MKKGLPEAVENIMESFGIMKNLVEKINLCKSGDGSMTTNAVVEVEIILPKSGSAAMHVFWFFFKKKTSKT